MFDTNGILNKSNYAFVIGNSKDYTAGGIASDAFSVNYNGDTNIAGVLDITGSKAYNIPKSSESGEKYEPDSQIQFIAWSRDTGGDVYFMDENDTNDHSGHWETSSSEKFPSRDAPGLDNKDYGSREGYYSISAHKDIWSRRRIISSSDRRIKKDFTIINDDKALKSIRDIDMYTFRYIDILNSGTKKTLGFIAQEVGKIVPLAITTASEIIPNEYRLSKRHTWSYQHDTGKYKLTIPDLDLSGDEYNGNIEYKLYVGDLSGTNEEELVLKTISGEPYSFIMDVSYESIFIYGKK